MSSVPAVPKPSGPVSPEVVEAHLCALLRSMVAHDGYADLRVESRILKRGQKELILHFGHQYRFVVEQPHGSDSTSQWQPAGVPLTAASLADAGDR